MLDSRTPSPQYVDEEQARDKGVQKEIERLMHETRIWRVANSAQWVAWGIVQAKVEGMDEALEEARERKRLGVKGLEIGKKVMDKIMRHGGTNDASQGTESEGGGIVEVDKQDRVSPSPSLEGKEEEDEDGTERPHVPHEHEIDDDAEFDYLAYAQDRALFFWGDMLELGLVQEAELPTSVTGKAKRVAY